MRKDSGTLFSAPYKTIRAEICVYCHQNVSEVNDLKKGSLIHDSHFLINPR
jgi:hypothetical protein